MIILHCIYRRGFFVWGEQTNAKSEPSISNFNRFNSCVPSQHRALDLQKLLEVLDSLGVTCKENLPAMSVTLSLPLYEQGHCVLESSKQGGFSPSHQSSGYSPSICSVDTLGISPHDLMKLNAAYSEGDETTTDGRIIIPDVMMSLDFCWLMESCRFAASLMDNGKFLPDLQTGSGTLTDHGEIKYKSIWRAVLSGNDGELACSLIKVMPKIFVSIAESLNNLSKEQLFLEIIDYIIDEVIRYSWTQQRTRNTEKLEAEYLRSFNTSNSRQKKTAPSAFFSLFKPDRTSPKPLKRGKLINSLSPYTLWLRSLGWRYSTGRSETNSSLNNSFEAIAPDIRYWQGRFEWFTRSPYKLCLKFVELSGRWALLYFINKRYSNEVIPAEFVWCSESGTDAFEIRRYFVFMLGLAGEIIKPLGESLERHAPNGCYLSAMEASVFVSSQANIIKSLDICVILPDWCKSASKITIRGRVSKGCLPTNLLSEIMNGKTFNTTSYLLELEWKLALDNTLLSDDEAALILNDGISLLQLHGEWKFIHPEHLEKIRIHINKAPVKMTISEALRLSVKDSYIDGFINADALEEARNALVFGLGSAWSYTPSGMVGALRPYQLKGYSWLCLLSNLELGACLADDMGLGKTIQTLAMIKYHHDKGESRPVLVICPTSVLENWRLEASNFIPDISVYLHHGHRRAKGSDFLYKINDTTIVLSSYSILQRDAELFRTVDWAGIVLDEAQNIKNPETRRTGALKGLKADWRIALTGTPIENHLIDLWSIMEFIVPGLLGNRRIFKEIYIRNTDEKNYLENITSLKRTVAPFILRRMKSDPNISHDLPEKIETFEFCCLKKEQIIIYSEVANKLKRNISDTDGIRRKGLVLAALTHLKQICDHPALFTKDDDHSISRSAKLERAIQLASDIIQLGEKALFFTQYVGMGNILKMRLQEKFGREVPFLHGGVPMEIRDKMISSFQNKKGTKFFVLSLKAGGVGLNLTGANHVIMYDRWWNPAVEQQAIDRAHRIGQLRNVHVHIFSCKGTLEERIGEIISAKKSIADSVIESGDRWITELSDSEIYKLISLSGNAKE